MKALSYATASDHLWVRRVTHPLKLLASLEQTFLDILLAFQVHLLTPSLLNFNLTIYLLLLEHIYIGTKGYRIYMRHTEHLNCVWPLVLPGCPNQSKRFS